MRPLVNKRLDSDKMHGTTVKKTIIMFAAIVRREMGGWESPVLFAVSNNRTITNREFILLCSVCYLNDH